VQVGGKKSFDTIKIFLTAFMAKRELGNTVLEKRPRREVFDERLSNSDTVNA
jgi:hypothetical protein